MSDTTNNTLTVFLDSIGRTIIGKPVAEDATSLTIENPALVHVQPNVQTNQLQLQILPLFFREFLKDKGQATTWKYNKGSITPSGALEFADQFFAQYEQIFKAAQPAPSKPDGSADIVKLFDEE